MDGWMDAMEGKTEECLEFDGWVKRIGVCVCVCVCVCV